MTEEQKTEAIEAAKKGEHVAILCMDTQCMMALGNHLHDILSNDHKATNWKLNGLWLVFPDTGGLIMPVFKAPAANTFDRLYCDPLMSHAIQRYQDALTHVRPKERTSDSV